MTKSTETISGQIWGVVKRFLQILALVIGYIFAGIGAAASFIGRKFGQLGGKSPKKPATESKHVERPARTEEVETVPTVETTVAKETEVDIPTTRAEILAVIKSAPYQVFPKDERRLMEAVLTLKERPMSEIMIPKNKIVYVDHNELLGPVALDRLYQSKMLHFPVRNAKKEVIGAIHTASLNSLEVKESFRAGEILDPNVYYLREDYTMAEALDTFMRNECYFCLVVNDYGKIVGMVNFSDLAAEIFGGADRDDFNRDDDPLAVAKRRN